MQANLHENPTRYEGEIQRLFKQLQTMSPTSREQPCSQAQDSRSQSAASSCSSNSSGSRRLTRKNSVPNLSSNESAAEGQSSSSECSQSSVPSPSQMVGLVNISTVLFLKPRITIISQCCVLFFLLSQDPLSMSPGDVTVSHFLEEENLRSKELLQRLDTYIHDMRENNIKTASKHLPAGSEPEPAQTSVQSSQ